MAVPIDHNNDTFDQQNLHLTLQQFDFTCKTFTDAMAIKYQLQYALFNGSYYFKDNNGTQVKVTGKNDLRNFIKILENLETLVATLQDIEVIVISSLICYCCMMILMLYNITIIIIHTNIFTENNCKQTLHKIWL